MIISFLVFITGCGSSETEIGLATLESTENALLQENDEIEESEETESTLISVYICGAVNAPGVYEFKVGDRLTQAVEKAEGFTENAHGAYLNLAQLLSDGEMIYVPTKEEVKEGVTNNSDSGLDNSGKININTASKDQLMTLTGVGESKALSIISYRESNGNFTAIEDVMKISGIKDAVFNTIKDYITV